jgi:N-acetylmuramoyl-L-alanine amidase
VGIYASIFVLLVVLIGIGYRAPQQVSGVSNAASLPATEGSSEPQAAVNEVVATNIAASVATATNLSVAPSVTSLAISTQIESELPTSDNSSISKPSIVQASTAGRNVTTHTVELGETVDAVAAKYGLTPDTIKWANNLTNSSLTPGQTLQILPRNGITYTVKQGDTVESIAKKYQADPSVITTYNDLEISGATPGLKIIIPNGNLPTTERPGYVAPVAVASTGGAYSGYRAGSVGNRYAFGNCTWYVYEKRASIGKPVGSFWGNGGSWGYSAMSAGYRVDNIPEAGAVLVERGSPGHVAFVESVGANGDVYITEMNNSAYGGFNRVNSRTIPAGQAGIYQYVH